MVYAIVRDLKCGMAELILGGTVDTVGPYDEMAAHARSINHDIAEDERNATMEEIDDNERNS
jgi:hypothetical protein